MVMYLAFGVSVIFLLIGTRYKMKFYGVGFREGSSLLWAALKKKWGRVLRDHVAQGRVMEKLFPGSVHLLIYSGIVVLFAGTTLVFLDYDILGFFGVKILQGGFYLGYEIVLDLLGAVFLTGLLLALFRRFIQKPQSLGIRWDDVLVLSGLIFVGLSGFVLEGMRIGMKPVEWQSSSFIGASISSYLAAFPQPILLQVYQALWWSHSLLAFGLLALTPFTKLGHLVGSWANSIVQQPKPMGVLNTPFRLKELMEKETFDVKVGLITTSDLGWRDRLSLDVCVDCGRCEEVCPASAAGRDLSPRLLVQDLSRQAHRDYAARVVSRVIEGAVREDEVWSCTACTACVRVCPVSINQLDFIVELRRGLVSENRIDEKKKAFLAGIDNSYNPFGLPTGERVGWLKQEGVPLTSETPGAEYLYWIGCQSSYDQRCRAVVRAMVKIMRTAGLSFSVLGAEEKCSGEPVRRLGEEGRFQQLALENIEVIKKHGVKKIVTHCAHCFNTLRNEYPELGGDFKVVHHSELLAELIQSKRIKLREGRAKITFHDPCNLARANKIHDAPRTVLGSLQGSEMVEMKMNRENTFCCGGGGANPWYTVPEKVKISQLRTSQAEETGAQILSVACPFCLTMFEDTTRGNTHLRVQDIAETVSEHLQPST